jgi:hypothetical protein
MKESAKKQITQKKNSFFNTLVSVVLLAVGIFSASYLTTKTFDFGGQLIHVRSFIKRFSGEVN